MARGEDDEGLSYIDAGHLFPDSMIKIGVRQSRHISAYQYDFLQMVAPYLDMETIKQVIATRKRQDREKLLQQKTVPSFREMQNSLKALKAVI